MKKNRILSGLKAMAAILAVATVTSCAEKEQVDADLALNDGSISFDTYTGRPGSRGGIIQTSDHTSFGVFAYCDGTSAYNATTSKPNFMWQQPVTWDTGTSKWTYSPLKYWPNNGAEKVSFFAYAPYTASPAAQSGNKSGVTAVSTNDKAGDPTLTWEVGKNVSTQVDLVYANAKDKTNATSEVKLVFKHALCRVGFKAVGWEPGTGETFDNATSVTINSVKICTNRKSATLNLNTGVWSSPSNHSQITGYKIATSLSNIQNNTIAAGTTTAQQLNLASDYIFMFPDLSGSGDDEYFIFVDYTVTTTDAKLKDGKIVKRNNVCRAIKPNFVAGKAYNIVLHLGMNGYSGSDDSYGPGTIPTEPDKETAAPSAWQAGSGDYISFTSEVTAWDEASELNGSLVQ